MKITKATVMMMGLLLTCLSFVSIARADGARSYISPSGSDNRPCSRNQPCRTFDGALAKTDAGGEIVAMEPARMSLPRLQSPSRLLPHPVLMLRFAQPPAMP